MPRPRAIDDDDLLLRVMLLFWRQGYANAGIRELEAASGLKAPSLYHRYGSKQALFQAALDHYLERVVSARIERYLKADDPLRGLAEFFHSTYEPASTHTDRLGCLLVNTAREFGTTDPEIQTRLALGNRMVRAALRDALRRARRQGLLAPQADLSALADALQLGLSGLLVSCRSELDKAVLKRSANALLSLLPVTARPRVKGPPP